MKTQIQAVLFDLDGTLIDTEPSAARAVQDCFSEWGLSVGLEDASYVTGRTWESAFAYLFSRYQIPVAEPEAKKLMKERYRQILDQDLIVVPGSVKAVQSLSSRYPLALVSGSGRKDILWALEKLEIKKHFEVILGAEDYPRSKPHPDGYMKAMETIKISPQSCVIFEDSSAGIQSARTAGAWVVAVTSTNHFQQDLSLAHMKISDLNEVTHEWVKHLSFD